MGHAIAEVGVDVHGEAGAVKSAGGRAAPHIAGAQEGLCIVHQVLPGALHGGGAGIIAVLHGLARVGPDIAGGAAEGDLIPAAVLGDVVEPGHLALAQGPQRGGTVAGCGVHGDLTGGHGAVIGVQQGLAGGLTAGAVRRVQSGLTGGLLLTGFLLLLQLHRLDGQLGQVQGLLPVQQAHVNGDARIGFGGLGQARALQHLDGGGIGGRGGSRVLYLMALICADDPDAGQRHGCGQQQTGETSGYHRVRLPFHKGIFQRTRDIIPQRFQKSYKKLQIGNKVFKMVKFYCRVI